MEHYFTLLNVADARKTIVLLYYLRDEASNTAFHLGISNATAYDEAKTSLMQHFFPVETPEELRTKFHQRYQGPDETLWHLAMKLRVLSSKSYKNMNADELEEMAHQQFILGVRNNVAREELIIYRPVSLRDAIEYGRLLEVAGRTVRLSGYNNVRSVFAGVPTGGNTRYNNRQTNQFGNQFIQRFDNAMRISSDGPRFPQSANPNGNQRYQQNANKLRRPIICFTCGKPGHKANVYRSGPLSSNVSPNTVKPNTNPHIWKGYK